MFWGLNPDALEREGETIKTLISDHFTVSEITQINAEIDNASGMTQEEMIKKYPCYQAELAIGDPNTNFYRAVVRAVHQHEKSKMAPNSLLQPPTPPM